MTKVSNNIHAAYSQALNDVWFNPEFKAAPRGQPIREILNYSFKVLHPVSEPIITCDAERNKVIAGYTAKEIELYDSCTNQVEDFAKASKFWEKLANPDKKTINSAYGFLLWKNKSCGNSKFELNPTAMRSPWEWCVRSLQQDKDTRQAVMKFSLPEHHFWGVKDFVCTLHGNWLIRDDKLYLSIVMRSGDMVKGAAYDWPWFIGLMDRMVEELKPTYPSLSKGTYSHLTHSLHIYEKDEAAILKMLGHV